MPSHKYREGAAIEHRDPDRGHQMVEGELPFDKGYETSNKNASPYFPEKGKDGERGNAYMSLQNKIKERDTAKLSRQMFSKIA